MRSGGTEGGRSPRREAPEPPRGGAEDLSGIHPVREALRARRRRLRRLGLRRDLAGPEIDEIRALAEASGVEIRSLEADDPALRGEGPNAQGVLLAADPLPELLLEQLLVPPSPSGAPRLLVALDGVEDPRNLGAIARVAEAAGAAGLILTRRHAPPLSAAVSRASAGAIEWLPVARVTNLRRALVHAKESGWWIFGCDESRGDDLYSMSPRVVSGDRVVVLGSEGSGLRQGIHEVLDFRVRIPMSGHIASLNVASAAAVVLFELQRRVSLGESPAIGKNVPSGALPRG